MKIQAFFVPALLVSTLNAGDRVKQPAAHRYPFSEHDKELFYNAATQKMDSPYSTASVHAFSFDTLVLIENDAYNMLHKHALQRNQEMEATALEIQTKIPKEEGSKFDALKKRLLAIKQSKQAFEDIKIANHPSGNIQLSERDLVSLLQWTRSITAVFLLITGSRDDFMLHINLGNTYFNATPLLKKFIIDNGDHQQEMPYRWVNEEQKS